MGVEWVVAPAVSLGHEETMGEGGGDQEWGGEARAELVLQILEGKTTVAEAASRHARSHQKTRPTRG